VARYRRRSGYRRRYRNSTPKPEIILYAAGLLAAWRFIASQYFLWLLITLFVVGTVAIIILFYTEHQNRQKLLRSGIDEVDKMNGHEFAEFLGERFKANRYKVTMPPRSGDFGADVIINQGAYRAVIQAKRSNSKVGIKAVQEVIGAVKYYGAMHGIVITNNHYTNSAEKLAASNDIEMWDRDKLVDFLAENNLNVKELPKEGDENLCPQCARLLHLKTGKHGQFWGCSSFPKCRFSKNLK